MPTKNSQEQDAIVRKAMREMGDGVEFLKDRTTPAGPHHYAAGSIGAGSDTMGRVTKGPGHSGPAEASEEK